MAIISLVLVLFSVLLLPRNAFVLNRFGNVKRVALFDQVIAKTGVDKSVHQIVEFAGIKLSPPLSTSLKQLGITNPSPIQQASIIPLSSGASALLHAATGTGKTLAYLLPALKRLLQIPPSERKPLQIVIIAPTKELALQIAADTRALLGEDGGVDDGTLSTNSMVGEVVSSFPRADSLPPIIIGTANKLSVFFSRLPAYPISPLQHTDYLVLDEVDRLLTPPSRYVTPAATTASPPAASPMETIVNLYRKAHGLEEFSGNDVGNKLNKNGKDKMWKYDSKTTTPGRNLKPVKEKTLSQPQGALTDHMQVIGVSATVGRPLAREMHKQFSSHNCSYGGQYLVLRPAEVTSVALRQEGGEEGAVRRVSIPSHIRHVLLIPAIEDEDTGKQGEGMTLPSRLALLKRVWNSEHTKKGEVVGNIQDVFPVPFKRGILFVPDAEQVRHTVNMLRAWRMGGAEGEIVDLLSVFGIEQVERAKKAKGGTKGGNAGNASSGQRGIMVGEKDRSIMAENPHAAGLGGSVIPVSTTKRTLFVAPFSGTRGLHLPDLDCVFIVEPPRTMDEYLHLAGRTGRMKPNADGREKLGAGHEEAEAGTVVVVTNQQGVRKLQGWQTSLDISFNLAFG